MREVVERYRLGVSRFTTSPFMRAKPGDALAAHDLSAYICESAEEARAGLRPGGGAAT